MNTVTKYSTILPLLVATIAILYGFGWLVASIGQSSIGLSSVTLPRESAVLIGAYFHAFNSPSYLLIGYEWLLLKYKIGRDNNLLLVACVISHLFPLYLYPLFTGKSWLSIFSDGIYTHSLSPIAGALLFGPALGYFVSKQFSLLCERLTKKACSEHVAFLEHQLSILNVSEPLEPEPSRSQLPTLNRIRRLINEVRISVNDPETNHSDIEPLKNQLNDIEADLGTKEATSRTLAMVPVTFYLFFAIGFATVFSLQGFSKHIYPQLPTSAGGLFGPIVQIQGDTVTLAGRVVSEGPESIAIRKDDGQIVMIKKESITSMAIRPESR